MKLRFKMVEELAEVEHMSLHECIRNTSIDATILTEHWLKTSRRPWTLERTIKIPV